jgi:hypothetical protein
VRGAERADQPTEGRRDAAALGGLRRWAGRGARCLARSLQGLLLLLLVVDLLALPLQASLHGPADAFAGGHGWHAGQDRLHIEPASGHAETELLDHSALRPASSIRPAARAQGDDPWLSGPDPDAPAAAAAGWLAQPVPLAAAGPGDRLTPPGLGGQPGAAHLGCARPWRGWCPPRQAPPRA